MQIVRTLCAFMAMICVCIADDATSSSSANDAGGPGSHMFMDDGGPGANSMHAGGPPSLPLLDGGPPDLRNGSSDDMQLRHRPRGDSPPPRSVVWGTAAIVVVVMGVLMAIIGWLLSSRAIRAAREAAERSLNQSRRFSADSAHELKTPLAVLQGVVEHAVSHADGDRALENLGMDVLEEVRRLKSIVNRLLLLSQSDAGKLPIHKQRIDMSELMALMMEDFALLAPKTKTESEIKPDVVVTADRSLLTQALRNIFSNAAKYNNGDAVVRCELTSSDGFAAVTVSNGVDPISPPDVDRIFDRFYRGDPAHGRDVEGAGLGLSLAKELFQAMGGSLTADLQENNRVAFTGKLPLA